MYCTSKNLVHCVCVGVPLSNCTHLSVCYETQISHVIRLILLGAWKEQYEYGWLKITTLRWNQRSLVCRRQNPGIICANIGLLEKNWQLPEICIHELPALSLCSGNSAFACYRHNSTGITMAPESITVMERPVLNPILWLLFGFAM